MRIASNDPRTRGNQTPDGIVVNMNISFTGNAVRHLSANSGNGINLKEWIWHEQVVNGERIYIITDKLNADSAVH